MDAVQEPSRFRREAFTLVELLVVMGIIVILLTMVVPATNHILKGSAVTQATDVVTGQLTLARQQALTKGHPVEVRFYQYTNDSGTNCYRALQTFESMESGAFVPAGKAQALPGFVIIDAGASGQPNTLSSILSGASASSTPTATTGSVLNVPLPSAGLQYKAVRFQFLPDGSTNLPLTGGPWFLTMHASTDGDMLTTPPKNFSTIEIDPGNGILRTFRP